MIRINKKVSAVGLISGGLDSTLATRIIKDLGAEIYGVYFAMPWGCCDKQMAMEVARRMEIKFITLQLDERYLEMVRKPKHGYGSAMNPCVDCRVHMFSRAAQYMKHVGADFVFTGEVLGQRPVSQMRHSMKWIEKETGLEGRLLRPLCAQSLEPTIPEQEGLIDRSKMLKITGRSRKPQIKLAEELDITEYNQPAGGCLLTDTKFARRMKDTLDHGYRNFRETVALKWGRHFRISREFKAIVGRNKEENESLARFAHPDDHLMLLAENEGPTLLLKGNNPNHGTLAIAGGLIQKYSKYKADAPRKIKYWPASRRNEIRFIDAHKLTQGTVDQMYV